MLSSAELLNDTSRYSVVCQRITCPRISRDRSIQLSPHPGSRVLAEPDGLQVEGTLVLQERSEFDNPLRYLPLLINSLTHWLTNAMKLVWMTDRLRGESDVFECTPITINATEPNDVTAAFRCSHRLTAYLDAEQQIARSLRMHLQ